jgi:hypothetical protein
MIRLIIVLPENDAVDCCAGAFVIFHESKFGDGQQ